MLQAYLFDTLARNAALRRDGPQRVAAGGAGIMSVPGEGCKPLQGNRGSVKYGWPLTNGDTKQAADTRTISAFRLCTAPRAREERPPGIAYNSSDFASQSEDRGVMTVEFEMLIGMAGAQQAGDYPPPRVGHLLLHACQEP